MQAISDLDLYHLAMEEPWFAADPIPEFDKARARHPWLATSNLGHVITHYPVVRELFANEERMRTSFDEMVEFMGAEGTPWGSFQKTAGTVGAESNTLFHTTVSSRSVTTSIGHWNAGFGAVGFEFT